MKVILIILFTYFTTTYFAQNADSVSVGFLNNVIKELKKNNGFVHKSDIDSLIILTIKTDYQQSGVILIDSNNNLMIDEIYVKLLTDQFVNHDFINRENVYIFETQTTNCNPDYSIYLYNDYFQLILDKSFINPEDPLDKTCYTTSYVVTFKKTSKGFCITNIDAAS